MRSRSLLIAFVLLACGSVPARAELVFFVTGRTLSVREHRVEGNTLVLMPRTGGEIVCEASLVERIAPDEVPYPEPEAESAAAGADAVPAGLAGGGGRLQPDPRYDQIIRRVAAERGVSAELVRAVIQVESAYQPAARSRKGAVGLMQVMPATGREYGVRNLSDPAANIEVGIRHLKSLLDRFPLKLALAAYNAGQAAVERFRGIPPYRETQDYVSRVMALVGG